MASEITTNLSTTPALNINSFADIDVRIFVSDQDDLTLINNSGSIPNNSIIISSTNEGNSLLCKDEQKIRNISYKLDRDWFEFNTTTCQLTINKEKLNSYVDERIAEYMNNIPEPENKDE